jgi:phosphatidylserine/phosphatidylglycerophosphate/cardiolipin synthase-like enzyme
MISTFILRLARSHFVGHCTAVSGSRHLGFAAAICASIAFACGSAGLKQGPNPTGDPGSGDDGSGADAGDAALTDGRDPTGDLDGAAPIPPTSAVGIQVIPSDNGLAVLNAIKGATKSVHMMMYLLSDTQVINALIALKQAGKDVKVILNQNFPSNQGSNSSVRTTLKNAGVNVIYAPDAFQYTHAKMVIIDDAKVLVMTMNLTQSSASQNREYIATDTDPADVADAEKIFNGDFTDVSTTVNGKLLWAPGPTANVDARSRLVALVDSAKTSVDLEGEELSEDSIVNSLVNAQKAGVKVRIVLDQQAGTAAQQKAVTTLKAAGVPVVGVANPTIHAKAIVVDGARAYIGSMNFTYNSLASNREVGLITDATAEIAKVSKTIGDDFAIGTAF